MLPNKVKKGEIDMSINVLTEKVDVVSVQASACCHEGEPF